MRKSNKIYTPSELRDPVILPQSTVQTLRDLHYFGSDCTSCWKSAYKKDYPYCQPRNAPSTPVRLHRKSEVMLQMRAVPAPVSEHHLRYVQAIKPTPKPEIDFRWSKGQGSNRGLLIADERLTNFTHTTSKDEHVAMPIAPREQIDRMTKLTQTHSVSLGNPNATMECIRAKNAMEYPRYPVPSSCSNRYFEPKPSQLKSVLDQEHGPFLSRTTVEETYKVSRNGQSRNARPRPIPQNLTPISSLFTMTNEPFGVAETRRSYKKFSPEDVPKHVIVHQKSAENLLNKDARIVTPESTSQSALRPSAPGSRCQFDANGRRLYQYKYGDILDKDLKTDPRLIPKHFHQQSMTQDQYKHWGTGAYQPAVKNLMPFTNSIPIGMEDGPPNDMLTTQQFSFPAHSVLKERPIRRLCGSLRTSLPLGAAMMVKETEFHEKFKRKSVSPLKFNIKDQQKSSIVEAKGVLDYGTTSGLAYQVLPKVIATRMNSLTPRDPILNDSSAWKTVYAQPPSVGDKLNSE